MSSLPAFESLEFVKRILDLYRINPKGGTNVVRGAPVVLRIVNSLASVNQTNKRAGFLGCMVTPNKIR